MDPELPPAKSAEFNLAGFIAYLGGACLMYFVGTVAADVFFHSVEEFQSGASGSAFENLVLVVFSGVFTLGAAVMVVTLGAMTVFAAMGWRR